MSDLTPEDLDADYEWDTPVYRAGYRRGWADHRDCMLPLVPLPGGSQLWPAVGMTPEEAVGVVITYDHNPDIQPRERRDETAPLPELGPNGNVA